MLNGAKFENLGELLDALEAERPGEILIRYMVKDEVCEVNTEAFFSMIRSEAARLTRLGLVGGHIGIVGRNSLEWLVSYYAILYTGSVAVLMGAEYTAEELLETAEQADVTAMIYDEALAGKVQNADFPGSVVLVPMFSSEQMEEGEIVRQPVKREELGCIFFTSGTTARKKAVMMSHKGLIEGVCNNIVGQQFTAQLALLPFHHLAGFNPVLNTLCLGGVLCLAGDFKQLFRQLEVMKPDYFFAVPSMVKVLVKKLKHSDAHGASLGWNLRVINCGGAKFQPEIVETLVSKDITIMQSYGASETGGIGFSWEMALDNPNTIGKAPEGMEAKIVDGELAVRSDTVMMGYYGAPEATEEVLRDGWYYTGDLARQDERGYYYLTGRKKNLIILSNGENVSPEELEEGLGACEQSAEVLVYEKRDFLAAQFLPDYTGAESEEEREAVRQSIRVFVEAFNDRMPTYKRISFTEFRDTPFEKNAMGKILRKKEEQA